MWEACELDLLSPKRSLGGGNLSTACPNLVRQIYFLASISRVVQGGPEPGLTIFAWNIKKDPLMFAE